MRLAVFSILGVLAVSATVSVSAAPVATPSPVPTPRAELKEIGRVRARSPYCAAFVHHFNASAHALLEHDASIGLVDYTYSDITRTFDEMGGDLKRIDERKKLAAYSDQLLRAIPAAQAEIDALRNASSLTSDPQQAKDNHELAKQLQRVLDRQKQIATDASGVVRALMEYDSQPRSAADSHLPGSYDEDRSKMPPDMLDVKKYVRIDELRDRIGDAESSAAGIADTIETRCS